MDYLCWQQANGRSRSGLVIPARPTMYQLGDLVEIGFTIAGTPLRGERVLLNYIMLCDFADIQIHAEKTITYTSVHRRLEKSKERMSERTCPKVY